MPMALSIRHKFLLVIVAILTVSLACYVWLAIRLFDSDKKAYIYDNSAALAETLGEEFATGLQGVLKTMRLVGATVAHQAGADADKDALLRTLVGDDEDFVELSVYRVDGAQAEAVYSFVRPSEIAPYGIAPEAVKEAARTRALPLAILAAENLHLSADALAGQVPVLTVMTGARDGEGPWHVVVGSLRQGRRMRMARASAVYRTFIMDGSARLLDHAEEGRSLPDAAYRARLLAAFLAVKTPRGVVTVDAPDGPRLVAFHRGDVGGLYTVAEIPVDQAYLASRRLMEKSAHFAALIVALAFFGSLLFTRRLTRAIQDLYGATRRVAQGDFDVPLAVRTRDEVGALASSFSLMTGEIKRLLAETREKARMERELETAQLVQDNFLPRGDVTVEDFEVAAFSQPASECGGDWWGMVRVGDSLAVMIGDATGHGVPAALLTAAAHSCTSTLARLCEKGVIAGLDCALLADQLNTAVHRAGRGRLQMTFFIMVVHLPTGRAQYVNASHLMPLRVTPAGDADSSPEGSSERMTEVSACDGLPGAILGKETEGRWPVHECVIGAGESLLLYTDGIVEARNGAGEEFGEGRLTRLLRRRGSGEAAATRAAVVEQFTAFRGEGKAEDDVTLLVIRRRPAQKPVQARAV